MPFAFLKEKLVYLFVLFVCLFASLLPLGRRVRVQNPRALHPGAHRGHAGGERLLLHGQSPPGEAVLDGEHLQQKAQMKSNPPAAAAPKAAKHLD